LVWSDLSFCLQIEIQTDDAVELAVSARYMVMASKARALSEQVYLSMSKVGCIFLLLCVSHSILVVFKDTPLRIEYPLDDHSVLAFYIAPRILDT
jgi:membrane-anchored protein YejM (alkaline phosphatase superfamily)